MQFRIMDDTSTSNATKKVLRQNQLAQNSFLNSSLNHLQWVYWIINPSLFRRFDLSCKWTFFGSLTEGFVISDRT